MNRRALVVVDMLNDFVREGAPLEVPWTRRILPALRREIQRSRGGGDAIVYVSDAHAPDDPEFSRMGWPPHAVKGTKGAEVVEELAPQPGDSVVEKTTYSGFFRTKLDEVLQERGVTDLTVAGCVTHICVLYTVSDADASRTSRSQRSSARACAGSRPRARSRPWRISPSTSTLK